MKQDPNTLEYFITVEITEKPLFIHFVGECVCNNDDPGNNPGGEECTFIPNFDEDASSITCTEITIVFDVEGAGSCVGQSVAVNSVNSGGFSTSGNVGFNPSFDVSTVTLSYTGLTPGQSYSFDVGVGFAINNDQGYQNFTFSNLETLTGSCFENVEFTGISSTTGFDCKSAEVNVSLESPSRDDVSILSLFGSYQQVRTNSSGFSTCFAPALSAPIPLVSSQLLIGMLMMIRITTQILH